jgi:hypothetical protein
MFFLLQGRDSNAIPHQKRNMGAIEPQSSLQSLLILALFVFKVFLKNFNFNFNFFSLLRINMFFMFLDYFNMLISKNIF